MGEYIKKMALTMEVQTDQLGMVLLDVEVKSNELRSMELMIHASLNYS